MGHGASTPAAGAGRARRAGSAIVLACALACTGLLGACGSSGGSTKTVKDLDVARVERAIERSILTQRHLKSTVQCPAKVLEQPGKFACIATTYAPGKPHKTTSTPFLVTIHNDEGYTTYVGK